jgi:hypothetical protein
MYSPLVTMWLMLSQRLRGGASLETAFLELRCLPDSFWPRPCKRLLEWREHGKALSSHTGAYNQAQQALPQRIVEESCDRMFEQLATKWLRPDRICVPSFSMDRPCAHRSHPRVV